jgi:hypothetical protein
LVEDEIGDSSGVVDTAVAAMSLAVPGELLLEVEEEVKRGSIEGLSVMPAS